KLAPGIGSARRLGEPVYFSWPEDILLSFQHALKVREEIFIRPDRNALLIFLYRLYILIAILFAPFSILAHRNKVFKNLFLGLMRVIAEPVDLIDPLFHYPRHD